MRNLLFGVIELKIVALVIVKIERCFVSYQMCVRKSSKIKFIISVNMANDVVKWIRFAQTSGTQSIRETVALLNVHE